ncbi:DUF4355 domain-containing protein [Turicibacter sanguinis]|uniref:DUF4355 domain-containing protein n=2 Tax=Turicibacter sanguinis TaxID=154288 RepID=A0A6G2CD74_9FIRM|nr:DUF4355 domain-containing protein [Turicibacter sanguinis]EFF65115.1 hypothetical protein CUW_0534 [Turicibacter sanguinis PC909]MTK22603.1 DUF4355 domain-containing protein [Turicibacter sanguinis]MTK70477.1 DUF4355 domain-containing protein [Turicibacter sanguinis]MTK73795.1 DUF4355 domain-containing protein [Turicibacter sanguinis]MTK81340.1 DUF4355 domain-containing protein [Turicibacter sanguinis]
MEDNQILNTNTQNQVSEQSEGNVETQPQDTKTFTQEELDRILTKRLEKETKKWEAKFNALEESQKLSQMNEEQKAEYDFNKKLEELQQREQELEAKINQYNQQQYKATITSQLQEAGLPVSMADLLVNMDAESVATQINAMKDLFSNQINAQIQAKVQASANVPTMSNEQPKALTMEDISKMSTQEIMQRKAEVDKVVKEYYMTK